MNRGNQELMMDLKESHGIQLQTPSIGTRVVSKVDAPTTISEQAMKAVRHIVECDKNKDPWVLYTKEDACDAMRSKQLIDEMNETIGDLRMAAGDMLDTIDDRVRKAGLYRAEVNRLRKILTTTDRELGELTELYCARCDQLEKIEMVIVGNLTCMLKQDITERIQRIIMEK